MMKTTLKKIVALSLVVFVMIMSFAACDLSEASSADSLPTGDNAQNDSQNSDTEKGENDLSENDDSDDRNNPNESTGDTDSNDFSQPSDDEANENDYQSNENDSSENDDSEGQSNQNESSGNDDSNDNSQSSDNENGTSDNQEDQNGSSENDAVDDSQSSESENEPNDNTTNSDDSSQHKLDLSEIPIFSGNPYICINGNQPTFSTSELTSSAYEHYSELDDKNRCDVAIASCGKEIMPTADDERGSISSIYPSGWVQASYDTISGGYLWNRCHLIGWQLSAENANEKNLITGTRYMNLEGMLPFENMVADYIKETDNHVAYRVTPIFDGDDLVCRGVQMEAYSIEDHGEGICFNVFCYNVQPGIIIDYATGQSSAENASSGNDTNVPEENNGSENNNQGNEDNDSDTSGTEMVWIPNSGTKYHSNSTCSKMKNPTKVSKQEAISRGYEPCKRCH